MTMIYATQSPKSDPFFYQFKLPCYGLLPEHGNVQHFHSFLL